VDGLNSMHVIIYCDDMKFWWCILGCDAL